MTGAPHVEVIVFDVGGVLCKFMPAERLAALATASGRPAATVHGALFEGGVDQRADRGELTLEENVDAVCAALGRSIGEDELLAAWSLAFPVDADVIELAAAVSVRRAVFSNNGPLLEACWARGLVDFRVLFDPVLFAWRLKVGKPDPLAYERAAAAIGAPPSSLLLVDDNESNVVGARTAGWQGLRFTNAEQLVVDVAGLGLLS